MGCCQSDAVIDDESEYDDAVAMRATPATHPVRALDRRDVYDSGTGRTGAPALPMAADSRPRATHTIAATAAATTATAQLRPASTVPNSIDPDAHIQAALATTGTRLPAAAATPSRTRKAKSVHHSYFVMGADGAMRIETFDAHADAEVQLSILEQSVGAVLHRATSASTPSRAALTSASSPARELPPSARGDGANTVLSKS
jgi:hypothetical protein